MCDHCSCEDCEVEAELAEEASFDKFLKSTENARTVQDELLDDYLNLVKSIPFPIWSNFDLSIKIKPVSGGFEYDLRADKLPDLLAHFKKHPEYTKVLDRHLDSTSVFNKRAQTVANRLGVPVNFIFRTLERSHTLIQNQTRG